RHITFTWSIFDKCLKTAPRWSRSSCTSHPSHVGDEAGLCPLLPNTFELLLGTCLRRVYG
ncbi:TPA: hypothetical protein N0F65_004854, partial [Lagenidium giganteum]